MVVQRQDEQQAEREFIVRMHQFVGLWNRFAGDYNARKVFIYQARQGSVKVFPQDGEYDSLAESRPEAI